MYVWLKLHVQIFVLLCGVRPVPVDFRHRPRNRQTVEWRLSWISFFRIPVPKTHWCTSLVSVGCCVHAYALLFDRRVSQQFHIHDNLYLPIQFSGPKTYRCSDTNRIYRNVDRCVPWVSIFFWTSDAYSRRHNCEMVHLMTVWIIKVLISLMFKVFMKNRLPFRYKMKMTGIRPP